MGDWFNNLYLAQMQEQQKAALSQQLAGMSNQVGGLLGGQQQNNNLFGLGGNIGISNGISAATAYAQDVTAFYDYNKAAFVVKPKPAPEKKPKKLSNLEWLDQRVNEMRVRL